MEEHDDYRRIERALHYIAEHVQQQPDLDEVAQHVHLSPFHFQRLFQRWAGVSPKKFLQFLTLDAAKQRLRENDDLLSASLAVGLSGPSRLHDLFLTIEGMTPGTYKALGDGLQLYYASFASPFGPCTLACTDRGLCTLSFFPEHEVLAGLRSEWPQAHLEANPSRLDPYYQAVFSTGQGPRQLRLCPEGSPFRLKVWEALLHVPQGRLVSYAQLAELAGRPSAVRAVASAVASNPLAVLIPCHRVIRNLGQVGGYRWGVPRKLALIGWENAQRGEALERATGT